MTKILKKSLACLLAFALCFTAVASCLAVSAAAPAMTSDVSFYTQSRPGDHRDDHANELCVGEKVRAQITLENIQAGSSIGIEVDLPTGLNPSEITYGTFDKGAKFDIVSKNYDEETGKFTMILDVTTTGDYVYFVYFIVGENVPQDRVFSLDYKIEATFASEGEFYKKTSAQPWPMRVFAEHVEETLEAVAPGCETTGLTEGSHCARCLETFKAQEEVAATGHSYGEGVIDPDAGCESTGIKTFTCVNGCGTSYTEVIDAKGHTEEEIPAVDATCTTDGKTAGVKCSVCDAVITAPVVVPAIPHEYVDGVCSCGAKDPDAVVPCAHEWKYVSATPAEGTSSGAGLANQTTTKVGSIELKCSLCEETTTKEVQYYGRAKCFTAAALYESAIILEFAGRKDRLAEAGEYTNGFVRFEHILPSGTSLDTGVSIIDAASGTRKSRDCKVFEYAMKPYQLTETINTTAFVEVNGVWYSGETFGYSVRSYADEVLPYDTVDDIERTLIVNMLRYGSRMQTFKGYNIENLADADLPAQYAAMITETDPVITGTYSKDDSIGNDCLQILTSYTLFMDSRTEARLRVRSDRFTADPAKDDFVIEANWTSSRKGAQLSESYYNQATAAEGQNVYTQDSQSANAGRWEFYFAGCAAYDFRQEITFKLYDPADPDTDLGNKFTASFEQLIAAGIATNTYGATELAMYKAMMNYSDAARAHFCK